MPSNHRLETASTPAARILDLPFANNPYPMWVFDSTTLTFLDVNDAAIQQYGYSREEFLHMTIADIRPDEDVPRLRQETAHPHSSTGEQWRHRRKDGTVFPVAITSWQIVFHGTTAELVLARPTQPSQDPV